MKRKANSKETVKKFNSLRLLIGEKEIPETEFRRHLNLAGINCSCRFCNELVCQGIMVRSKRHIRFVHPDIPVHISKLQEVYDSYYKKSNAYYRNYKAKKEGTEAMNSEEVQNAVKVLKDLGYEIYAPIGIYFTKL